LKKNVHKPEHVQIHHSIWGDIIFLSMGQKQDLPQFASFNIIMFYIFSYKSKAFNNISSVRFMFKFYFYIGTFQPKMMCSSAFKDTMTKWPVHKQTHRKNTRRTPKRSKYSEKLFCLCFYFIFFYINFFNDFSNKYWVTALVRSKTFIRGLNRPRSWTTVKNPIHISFP